MACCCCFFIGVHISCKYVILVKENQYQAFLVNKERNTTADHLPHANISPSYSTWDHSKNSGGLPALLTMEKFSVQRSEDEIGCFVLKDEFENQVCEIKNLPSCRRAANNYFYYDNQGNELISMVLENNAPPGSRQIGRVDMCLTCTCASYKMYGETSDFHLKVQTEQNGHRFKSSRNNTEKGQVFTTGKGANGRFPADLELAMKIAIITRGVALIILRDIR
ncbi:hypothetical protein HOLleu_02501 [Holothuria leucospilota]|uniref:Phospholipid scramblase n=1 Tax=Holothuria leucospilota TaxID=206669 RepID=A0A9Q1CSB1_HOLLE|nr:hypothetical protein HOLleu_02501 [Holothuria leucospilota]